MYNFDPFQLPSIDVDDIQRSVANIKIDSPTHHMCEDQRELLRKEA